MLQRSSSRNDSEVFVFACLECNECVQATVLHGVVLHLKGVFSKTPLS